MREVRSTAFLKSKSRLLLAAVILTACAPRASRVVIPASGLSSPSEFVDLQPGWRLRVVTPILKSGGFRVHVDAPVSTAASAGGGLNLDIRAGSDFVGYELAYYSVTQRIEFQSAVVTKDDKPFPEKTSLVKLFDLPSARTHFRLIYLQRISATDHDMAVLGANLPEQLDAETRLVQADPKACHGGVQVTCEWIPAGIAVNAEKRNRRGVWVPAT